MKFTAFLFLAFFPLLGFSQSLSKMNLSGFGMDLSIPDKSKNVSEYQHIIGDDAPDEIWSVTGDTTLVGDMILINQGQLILQEGSSLSLQGNLVCLHDSEIHAENADLSLAGHYYGLGQSVVNVDSCEVELPMDYRYQYGIFVMDTAAASFTNSEFSFGSGLLEGAVASSGNLNLERNNFAQSVTLSVNDHATLNVSECLNAWEFLLNDSCIASFSHNESLILWFYFPEDVTATYSFPNGVWVEDMDFNSGIAGLEEVPYSVSIDSCYNVNWGMFPMAGSDVTIENSDMRTCGWIFKDGGESTVSGLFNEQFYASETIDPGDRQLHLSNTRVRTWNFYSMNSSVLNVEGCFFGEALSMEDGTINAMGGICDGSGGYFGTNDANINAFSCQIECQVVMEGQSSGSFINSELYFPWSAHVFAGHTLAVFANTVRNQDFSVRDTSILVDLALDTLNMQSVNDMVTVRGNAQDFEGDDSPHYVDEYRLYYTSVDVPDDRNLIADEIPGGVYQNVIAHWNTDGLQAGEYLLYLQAIVNGDYDNPLEISQEVMLYDFTGMTEIDNSDVAVFPNPVSDVLYVQIPELTKSVTVELVNLLGETLRKAEISGNSHIHRFDVEDLSPGVYFLKALNNTLRIVKE